MTNIIRIKRSTTVVTPSSLAQGELAYSESTGTGDGELFIGIAGASLEKIGGFKDVTKLAAIADNADVTDSSSVAAAGAIMDGDFSVNGFMSRDGAGSYSSKAQLTATSDLTATGTKNSTTFLRGDDTWDVPVGAGDVSRQGSNADNQLVRWHLTTSTIQNSGILIDDSDNMSGLGTLNSHAIPGGSGDFMVLDQAQTMTALLTLSADPTANLHAATKQYVDAVAASEMTYKGGFDPTAGSGDGSPDLDSITSDVGDMYTVTVAGTYNWTTGSAVLEIGDVLIAESTGVLNNVSDWTIINQNLSDVVFETREVNSGVGLNGGGDLSVNRTLNLDLNSLNTDSNTDGAADFIPYYDASGADHNKVLINDLLDGGTF